MVLLPNQPEDSKYVVHTRSGKIIPCKSFTSIDPKIMQIHAQEIMKWHPVKLRSIDPFPYNCVGMIFASRRAWIEIDYIYELLRGDYYSKVSFDAIVEGDLVLYKDRNGNPSHIGLIMKVENLGRTPSVSVLSKWGKEAEFIHFMDVVNENLGKPAEFWTDRKMHAHVSI